MSEENIQKFQDDINAELARISSKKEEVASKEAKSEAASIDIKSTETHETHSETMDLQQNEQVDSLEEDARKSGWTSKEEWVAAGKDPRLHKSAERFIEDGSFFKKINELKRDNEETKQLVKQLSEHNAKLEKMALTDRLHDLQAKKMQAASEADVKRVQLIEEEQREVSKKISEVKAPVVAPIKTPELIAFAERNKEWFKNDKTSPTHLEDLEMVETADFIDKLIGKQATRQGIVLTQAEHLKMVEDKIKKEFPHRFANEAQSKPVMVAKSTTSGTGTVKKLADRLTSQQKDFVKKAQRFGSKLTEESYAQQLKITGDLRDE